MSPLNAVVSALTPGMVTGRFHQKTERARRRSLSLCVAAGLMALALWVPVAEAAKSSFKGGTYTAKTKQENVATEFRTFELKIKKGRVTLMSEPVVRKQDCTTVPVFTLEGATPRKPLSGRGAFTFTQTFSGTKIDKITGRYTSDSLIEGFVVYNFMTQNDLCTEGSVKVDFTARKGKKKKKK